MRLAQQVGVPAVIAEARKLGVTAPLSEYPAMALGTSPMTLLELTQAYAAVARGSRPVKASGLDVAPDTGMLATVRETARALTPWPARGPMLELLRSAVHRGTGTAARLPISTYGKTGTTQNHRDALFIGFAGDLVVGVWVGRDDNTPMNGVVGGGVPARLWKRFMLKALAQEGRLRAPAPPRDSLDVFLGDVAGPEAGAAIDAMGGVVEDAVNGEFSPERAAEAADRVRDAVDAPPQEEAPPL